MPFPPNAKFNRHIARFLTDMPPQEQLRVLRDHYLALLRLEIDEFGVKTTKVRHLIGRLGEIHAALLVGGEMGTNVRCCLLRSLIIRTLQSRLNQSQARPETP